MLQVDCCEDDVECSRGPDSLLDPEAVESAKRLERFATDAQGSFRLGKRRGILAGRQAAGVYFARRHRQALGRRLGGRRGQR